LGQITVDTKDRKDIPHSWPQRKASKLPKYQFTARKVRSGLTFLGFANQKTDYNTYYNRVRPNMNKGFIDL